MVIIYDFDGTLTPYGLPQYEILKKCGYNEDRLKEQMDEAINQKHSSIYQAYYQIYENILKQNNIVISTENIILGAQDVEFNPGVLEFFNDLQEIHTGVKHFIVTSGWKEYVCNTKIEPFVNGIYGVTYKSVNGIYTGIDELVSDVEKPVIIRKILTNSKREKVVYMGDGLTDKYAFEYVHSIGGICLYVGSTDEDVNHFNRLKNEEIVDEFFDRDFSTDSKLRQYIEDLIKNDVNRKISID